jgi:hypothetical protein
MVFRVKFRMPVLAAIVALWILAWPPVGAAAAAVPKPSTSPGTLWANGYEDLQTPGLGVVSDRYSDPAELYASSSSQAADDFTVPNRATWTIREVDVHGFYNQPTGSLDAGPADAFTVSFAPSITLNGVAQPDDRYLTTRTARTPATSNAFTLGLDAPVVVGPGRYWVIVTAEINYTLHGQWRWMTSGMAPKGASAVWRHATPDQSCSRWCTLPQSWPSSFSGPTDLRFQLVGTAA